jgi:hypothetical protein
VISLIYALIRHFFKPENNQNNDQIMKKKQKKTKKKQKKTKNKNKTKYTQNMSCLNQFEGL